MPYYKIFVECEELGCLGHWFNHVYGVNEKKAVRYIELNEVFNKDIKHVNVVFEEHVSPWFEY